MTASEKSFVGLAKQVAKGTPNVTDADFQYLLFNQGGLSASPVMLPVDPEVGGGALLRDVVKAGVVSGGQLQLVPRPSTLGMALLGVTGKVVTVDNVDLSYTHSFTLDTDQFAAPYFTGRSAPGNMWGEQFQDMRFTNLSLAWRGGRFLTGAMGLIGGLPKKVATTAWSALAKVDGGPQFLAPLGAIELPTGSVAKVLSGSFVASSQIPLDEQWIVGSYSPDGLDITQRAFMLQMALKIDSADLYTKMMYDPAAGADWVASVFREAAFKLEFKAAQEIAAGVPYSISIAANGKSDADANVVWSATPIQMQAGRNIIMNVVGTFLADNSGATPITVELVNKTAAY